MSIGPDLGPDRGRNPFGDLDGRLADFERRLSALEVGGALPFGVHTGTGSPEGVVEGSEGDLYIRQGGGVGSTWYVKETSSGTTGWAAK